MTTLKDNDGRAIKVLYFPNGEEARSGVLGRIVCSYEFHGEYANEWGVVLDQSGKEISRHNLGYVQSIEWEP